MQVSVENALSRVDTGVKDGSIPVEATFCGDLVCSQEKVSGDGRAISRNSCRIFCVQGWYQQNMCWRLWIQIIKRDNVFIAQHDIRGDVTFNDFAEDAVGI